MKYSGSIYTGGVVGRLTLDEFVTFIEDPDIDPLFLSTLENTKRVEL